MHKMNDDPKWMIPAYAKAYEAMLKEDPIIDLEFTESEMEWVIRFNKSAIISDFVTHQKSNVPLNLLMLAILVYLLISKYQLTWANVGLVTFTYLSIGGLLSIGDLYRRWIPVVKRDPRLIISNSGLYLLGKFTPFRLAGCKLVSCSLIEGEEGEPTVLRLCCDERGEIGLIRMLEHFYKGVNTFEIPIRKEMLGQIDQIIQTLLPNENEP